MALQWDILLIFCSFQFRWQLIKRNKWFLNTCANWSACFLFLQIPNYTHYIWWLLNNSIKYVRNKIWLLEFCSSSVIKRLEGLPTYITVRIDLKQCDYFIYLQDWMDSLSDIDWLIDWFNWLIVSCFTLYRIVFPGSPLALYNLVTCHHEYKHDTNDKRKK